MTEIASPESHPVSEETARRSPVVEKAAIGMYLPGLLVGVLGVIMLWGMFGKEEGYDWSGFELSTFLQGMGLLLTAGLLVTAGWGVGKGRRWAPVLGMALCGLGLCAGLLAGYEWATGGDEVASTDAKSKVELLALIAILTVGSIFEAVLLVRVFFSRPA
ncbi:MAG: hypothetical protein AAF288_12850 [Planctomycetota bacterium]